MISEEKYPRSSIEDDFNYGTSVASASLQIRMGFLRKVYSILPAVVLVSALGSLVLLLALAVYRHKHPTLLEAISVATAVSFYEYKVVLQAFFLTCAVFLCLTTYTFQSKRDFSKLGAGLFAALLILIVGGVMRLFFNNEVTELLLACGGALVFCGFIIYDTHLLMHRLSPEEHVLASINLYLDIINLFINVLRILDSMKKN
ncbi:hypothetical protein CRUP_025341 [Coryphaenoides rupestris]|nr:hypothetical protein CRUP_025341 [Coryphaenoides rupestris]